MDSLFGNATTLLTFLLPGFLSAWIFYGLTSHPKPTQFERTVEALVFTFVVQALVKFTELALELMERCVALGQWTQSSSLLWGFIFAGVLGTTLAHMANAVEGWPPVDGIPQGMAGQSDGRIVLHPDAGLDRGHGIIRCRRLSGNGSCNGRAPTVGWHTDSRNRCAMGRDSPRDSQWVS